MHRIQSRDRFRIYDKTYGCYVYLPRIVYGRNFNLAHSWFNVCAPELVPICYSAIKHGYLCFTSAYELILRNPNIISVKWSAIMLHTCSLKQGINMIYPSYIFKFRNTNSYLLQVLFVATLQSVNSTSTLESQPLTLKVMRRVFVNVLNTLFSYEHFC